ncbi:MAG: hypothetical protein Q4B42_07630 [Oscillospiraceae bacterium]|nr:hypothetical protein [Oscillospiraceae bacterium]
MKHIKPLRLVSLLAALSLLLAGCAYNPENVLTIDGEVVPAGRWLYYQMVALSDATAVASDETGETLSETAVLDYTVEGLDAREWIRAETEALCKRHIFIEREFERLGLEFTEEELASFESSALSAWDYYAGDYYEANGIGYESFLAVYTNSMMESEVRSTLFAEDGEMAISAEEKQDYFNENFAYVEYIRLPDSDSAGFNMLANYTDEFVAIADSMLARAQESDLTTAYLELYGEVLELAQDTETVVSEENASSVVLNATMSEALGYSEELCSAALACEPGGYTSAESGGTLYILHRTAMPEEENAETYDSYILDALSSEPFESYIEEATAAYELEADERAAAYYSPDKIYLPY